MFDRAQELSQIGGSSIWMAPPSQKKWPGKFGAWPKTFPGWFEQFDPVQCGAAKYCDGVERLSGPRRQKQKPLSAALAHRATVFGLPRAEPRDAAESTARHLTFA
jgi:hypothetical protein